MNELNSRILVEKYNYMFSEMRRSQKILKQVQDKSPLAGSGFYGIAFGFECEDGWFDLLDELMEKIQEIDKNKIVNIHQVKEKFGGLRFYIGDSTDEIDQLIEEAEKKSEYTCEVCGKPGELCEANHWLKTVCPEHRQMKNWVGVQQNYKPVKKYL